MVGTRMAIRRRIRGLSKGSSGAHRRARSSGDDQIVRRRKAGPTADPPRQDFTSRLCEAITTGRFMPNERLIETDLSAWLGTNRANVRTALARLEQEGLVVCEPKRGARVRRISDVEAIEIMQARGALEILVARQAALRATEEDRFMLRAIVDEMRAAIKSGDLLLYSRINGKLHSEIRRIANHATAARLLSTLRSQIVRFQYRAILFPGRAALSLAEHEDIVEAICGGDAEAAERTMGKHLCQVTDNLRQAIEASKMVDA
jgi:DNA-binding GntR family transcriptional regulator